MTGIYNHRHERFKGGASSDGVRVDPGFTICRDGRILVWPEREWYRTKEVKLILNVSHQTVHRAIHSGALKAERIGGVHNAGKWLISPAALKAFIAASQKMSPKGRRRRT